MEKLILKSLQKEEIGILVFIFVFVLILLLVSMIIFSTIRLEVQSFELSNMDRQENKEKNNYHVVLSFYLFNRFKWLWFHLNSERTRKMYSKIQLEKFDLRTLEKDFKLKDLKELRKLELKLSYFNLKVKLGTEDAILTSFIVCLLSFLISIILPHVVKKYQKEKYDYVIEPLYFQKNLYEIKFNCIIEVKIVHIIYISYIFWKKRRGDKNERTSNRRSYGYSYE